MATLFTEREARALAPPEKLSPSQWAEENRYLPSSVAAEPGRYRNSRTPYIAGIIDAILEPWLEELVILKAAQLGFTTALQNLIGWCVCQEPAPSLLVMPSEDECAKIVKEQLVPLIETTPILQDRIGDSPRAVTQNTLLFDSMPLYLGWAGSPQSLARRACRYVFLDEVDKYPSFSGRDAAPIPLARKRSSTYLHRARIVIGSTPTTRDGAIWQAYEGCGDRRLFWVPCPHCSSYQTLAFSQIIFNSPDVTAIEDRAKQADFIATNNAAHYECCHCKGTIRDKHKPAMLNRGVWLSEGQTVSKDGGVHGERPKAKRVGFQISAIYSPWVSFSQMAAQFVRSIGNHGAMMEFKNQWLGEVFEDVETSFKVDDLRLQVTDAPPAGTIPTWADRLIATADVHEHRINFVLRAHGRDDRSQLIHFGDVPTFEDLTKLCLDSQYMIDGGHGDSLQPCLLFIDAGYRTDEVYSYAQTDARIKAILGARDFKPRQMLAWSTPAKSLGISVCTIDTQYFKSKLATLRSSGKWIINNGVTDEYLRHMAGEHKIVDREGRSIWQKISSGAQNHFLDCEVYQLAAADFIRTDLLPDEGTLERQRAANREQRRQVARPAPRKQSWLGNTSQWLQSTR
jgi:phage terminase large subunit GpA-like protein